MFLRYFCLIFIFFRKVGFSDRFRSWVLIVVMILLLLWISRELRVRSLFFCSRFLGVNLRVFSIIVWLFEFRFRISNIERRKWSLG